MSSPSATRQLNECTHFVQSFWAKLHSCPSTVPKCSTNWLLKSNQATHESNCYPPMSNWTSVSNSQYPWEQESLEFPSSHLPSGNARARLVQLRIRGRRGFNLRSGRLGHRTLGRFSHRDQEPPTLHLNIHRGLEFALPLAAEQRRIVINVDQLMALVDQLEAQLEQSRSTATNLLTALVAKLTANS